MYHHHEQHRSRAYQYAQYPQALPGQFGYDTSYPCYSNNTSLEGYPAAARDAYRPLGYSKAYPSTSAGNRAPLASINSNVDHLTTAHESMVVPRSISTSNRPRKRLSSEQHKALLVDAAKKLFTPDQYQLYTTSSFCEHHGYQPWVRQCLDNLLNEEEGLHDMVRKWNDYREEWMEEVHGMISNSQIINPKRRRQCTDHIGPDSPYWQSTNAFNLFGSVSRQEGEDNDDDIDLRQVIKDRIVILKNAWTTATGWEDIVSGKRSDLEHCTDTDKHLIKQKARYVYLALQIALDSMPKLKWHECCKKAIDRINSCDLSDTIQRPRTITDWHSKFCAQCETFANPAIVREGGRPSLPPFLEKNPDFVKGFVEHGKENLHKVTIEFMHAYVHEIGLKSLSITRTIEMKEQLRDRRAAWLRRAADEEWDENGLPVIEEDQIEEFEFTVEALLKEGRLRTLDLNTVGRWMHALGFKYETRRKHFYVDCHEKPEVTAYRDKVWCPRYFERELRAHRWVWLTPNEVDKMIKDGKLDNDHSGILFTADNGKEMVEFHVDSHEDFHALGAEQHEFGGRLSHRIPDGANPVIIFGQDEAIFKQFSSMWKAWSGPGGLKAIWPKDDGIGVMVSAIVSREFGFGVEWTPALKKKVNERRRGQTYSDKEAAFRLRGTSEKEDLTSSPLVKEFEHGLNNEGYWKYEHMAEQIEDATDVIKVMLEDRDCGHYDIVFMLDHSQNHNKKKPDGLNASRMNKLFGGEQPKMRDTHLADNECIGPYQNTTNEYFKMCEKEGNIDCSAYHASVESHPGGLGVGDTQSMVFDIEDPSKGPFYLSMAERKDQMYDKETNTVVTKQKNMEDLRKDLTAHGLGMGGKSEALKQRARAAGIPLAKTFCKVIKGWFRQPKGMLQVAMERGFIDPRKYNPCAKRRKQQYYTEKGRKDTYGNHDEKTSLRRIMEAMPDFVSEETLLQYHAKKIGASVDHSPKAHPELAGEGVEYDWGFSKLDYRRQPLELKRDKKKFRALVKRCISRANITIELRRKFSRRARGYSLCYRAMALQKVKSGNSVTGADASLVGSGVSSEGSGEEHTRPPQDVPELSASLIEKLIKEYKVSIKKKSKSHSSHRSTLDQDKGYIAHIIRMITSTKGW